MSGKDLKLKKNFSLRSFNTFGIDSEASSYIQLTEEAQLFLLPSILQNFERHLILGGGSNVLLPDYFDGLLIHVDIDKISFRTSKDDVLVSVGAGVEWHRLVQWAVDNNFGGIENLALIPGKTGAAPIQNIGAYGVELKDVFVCLRAFDLKEKQFVSYNLEECEFNYRDSIFKRSLKGRLIITEVWLKLTRTKHKLDTSYKGLADFLLASGIQNPSIDDIFRAVIEIRRSKLPDPSVIGNAGSFFKNPVVTQADFLLLKEQYPDVVGFDLGNGMCKIPAAWLIEQSNFKGKFNGPVGCHKDQALVLVNKGGAKSEQIIAHAAQVQETVNNNFGILLEPEVNIIQADDNQMGLLI